MAVKPAGVLPGASTPPDVATPARKACMAIAAATMSAAAGRQRRTAINRIESPGLTRRSYSRWRGSGTPGKHQRVTGSAVLVNYSHGQPRIRLHRDHARGAAQGLCLRHFSDGGERRGLGTLLDRARAARRHSDGALPRAGAARPYRAL